MKAHAESSATALPTEQDPRWGAVVARDSAADGAFFYSVATTGVYCNPSCKARLALPKNVRFHETRVDAERAGFRPCKRCKPDRRRTQRDELQVTITESSIGLVLVAQSEKGVSAVLLGDDRDALRVDLQSRFPNAVLTDHVATWDERTVEVIQLVESPERGIDAPLDMRGSEFQRKVWRALREIPVGTTASYTEVANSIGQPNSVRAVAAACAANNLAVIVPCHRVVRGDGELSGYRWGVERKRALLDREASA